MLFYFKFTFLGMWETQGWAVCGRYNGRLFLLSVCA